MSTKVSFVTFDSVSSRIEKVLASGTAENMVVPKSGDIIRFFPNAEGYEVGSILHVIHGTRTAEIFVYLKEILVQ